MTRKRYGDDEVVMTIPNLLPIAQEYVPDLTERQFRHHLKRGYIKLGRIGGQYAGTPALVRAEYLKAAHGEE